MLSRLFKYEIKATGRIFLPLFLSLLVFALINKIIFAVNPQEMHTSSIISMSIYIIIMAGMFVMTFTMMIQRFYKNLLTDEGYLMHTLPVKPWKHIVSKLLVSMLWMLSSVLVAMISILIIAYKKGSITDIFHGLVTIYTQAINQIGAWTYLLSLESILAGLLILALGILIIYTSIAVGHLSNRHKMLASFVAFIIFNIFNQIFIKFTGSWTINMVHYRNIAPDDFQGNILTIQLVICAVIIFSGLLFGAYFAVTNYILSRRLNLE